MFLPRSYPLCTFLLAAFRHRSHKSRANSKQVFEDVFAPILPPLHMLVTSQVYVKACNDCIHVYFAVQCIEICPNFTYPLFACFTGNIKKSMQFELNACVLCISVDLSFSQFYPFACFTKKKKCLEAWLNLCTLHLLHSSAWLVFMYYPKLKCYVRLVPYAPTNLQYHDNYPSCRFGATSCHLLISEMRV